MYAKIKLVFNHLYGNVTVLLNCFPLFGLLVGSNEMENTLLKYLSLLGRKHIFSFTLVFFGFVLLLR